MQQAVEVQLDPDRGPREQKRLLDKVLRRIDYAQRRQRISGASHRRTRIRELHRLGICLKYLRKCFGPSLAL